MRVFAAFIALCSFCPAVLAQTPQSPAPVDVNSCFLTFSNAAGTINGLDVQFTNNATKTAKVVNIHTDINGAQQIIRDEGSFSPGIQIHHHFRAGGGQFALPVILNSSCAALSQYAWSGRNERSIDACNR